VLHPGNRAKKGKTRLPDWEGRRVRSHSARATCDDVPDPPEAVNLVSHEIAQAPPPRVGGALEGLILAKILGIGVPPLQSSPPAGFPWPVQFIMTWTWSPTTRHRDATAATTEVLSGLDPAHLAAKERPAARNRER
jgi:hypothetical protein